MPAQPVSVLLDAREDGLDVSTADNVFLGGEAETGLEEFVVNELLDDEFTEGMDDSSDFVLGLNKITASNNPANRMAVQTIA